MPTPSHTAEHRVLRNTKTNGGASMISVMLAIAAASILIAMVLRAVPNATRAQSAGTVATYVEVLIAAAQSTFDGNYTGLGTATPFEHQWFPPESFALVNGVMQPRDPVTGVRFGITSWRNRSDVGFGLDPTRLGMSLDDGFVISIVGLTTDACVDVAINLNVPDLWIGSYLASTDGAHQANIKSFRIRCSQQNGVIHVSAF